MGRPHGQQSLLTYHSDTSQSLSYSPSARDDHPLLLVGGTQWENAVVVSIFTNKFPLSLSLFSVEALSFSLSLHKGISVRL